jgi:hypothetical protein
LRFELWTSTWFPKGDQYSPHVALKKTPATGSPRLYSLAHVVMLKRIREVGGGGKKGAVGWKHHQYTRTTKLAQTKLCFINLLKTISKHNQGETWWSGLEFELMGIAQVNLF